MENDSNFYSSSQIKLLISLAFTKNRFFRSIPFSATQFDWKITTLCSVKYFPAQNKTTSLRRSAPQCRSSWTTFPVTGSTKSKANYSISSYPGWPQKNKNTKQPTENGGRFYCKRCPGHTTEEDPREASSKTALWGASVLDPNRGQIPEQKVCGGKKNKNW